MKKRYARILAATLSAALVFTSAPTAAFATEFDVVEDAVEAEGAAKTAEAVAALFPTTISKVFKSSTGAIAVTGGAFTAASTKATLQTELVSKNSDVEAAEVTGLANVDTMRVGEECTATMKLTIKAASAADYAAFDDDADHSTVTITRTAQVKCVKGTIASLAPLPSAGEVFAAYGTGVVKLDDAVTAWTIVSGSTTASVKTTDVASSPVVKGVKIQTVATYDTKDYDTEAFETANPTYKYNATTKRFETEVNVAIVKAEIKLSAIKWPTGLEKAAYVGDDLSASGVKLAGTLSKEGTYAVTTITDKDYEGGSDGAGTDATADKAGEQTVKVTFTADGNHTIVDDMESTVVTTTGTAAVNSRAFKTVVSKKTISDADIALKYITKEVEYGTTYSAAETACLNTTNSYVDYTLKDASIASKVMPKGAQKVAYVATLKGALKDSAELTSGRNKVTVYADITVKVPEAASKITTATGGVLDATAYKAAAAAADLAKKVGDANVTVEAATYLGAYLEADKTNLDVTYQWYKDGVAISGATTKAYAISSAAAGVAAYNCVVTVKAKDSASADTKAILADVLPTGTITTSTISNTVTNLTVAKASSDNLKTDSTYVYEYKSTIKASAKATYDGTGYETTGVKAWIVKDGTTEKVEITSVLKDIEGNGDVTVTAPVPAGLGAGDYHVYIEFDGVKTADKTIKDVALYSGALKINKLTLDFTSASDIKTVETSYKYGTKSSDIKVASKQAEKYGTYALSTEVPEYILAGAATAYAVVFTPAEGVKDNYNITSEPTVNVTIDKADLKFNANKVEITIGEKLPTLTANDFTVEGVAAKDRYEELGITKVELSYVKGAENMIGKVGTIAEAVEIKVTPAALTNYNIVEVPADIVVKEAAAPTVAPTTAPTTAPTAAPVKAEKAKVTVAAGKSVQLKLANAGTAKVTWAVDKKAKKAVKVSKNGKVKVLKKAKKGTYKVYATVNGKKVTFKIKVK